MKNKFTYILILIVFNTLFAFNVPSNDTNFVKSVTDHILNCQFDSAIRLTDIHIEQDQSDPLPPVLKLAALGMRDVDLEMTVDSALFLSTYSLAVECIDSYEKKYGLSSYSRTILGFSKTIHSTYFLRRKMYVTALQNGLDALKLLRDAKTLDTTNTDVDFFLGLYDYGKAEMRKRLWWVLFWYPGGKKEGIQKLEQCSKTACMTKNAAKLSLSEIYISEKNNNKALLLIEQLETSFPESRFVYWAKAKYYETNKMYNEAAAVYNQLSLIYSNTEKGSYNSLFTKNKEAAMCLEAGNKEKAAALCKSILADPALLKRDLKKDTEKLLEKINES
jgi:tetratricopeptide (TPR) repeat protein